VHWAPTPNGASDHGAGGAVVALAREGRPGSGERNGIAMTKGRRLSEATAEDDPLLLLDTRLCSHYLPLV
jgi:hypothetical protein